MKIEQIKEIDAKFYGFVRDTEDINNVFNKFEGYLNFLNGAINDPSNAEVVETLIDMKYNMLYQLVYWMVSNNVIAKQRSTNWNGFLVRQVGDNCKQIRLTNTNGYLSAYTVGKVMSMIEDIEAEQDFATKAYCYQIIQTTGGINLAAWSKIINKERDEAARSTNRPRMGGGFVKDDGSKYWHTGAKELMTYDECTEKGLGQHLLSYPIGSQYDGLYVGFEKCEKSNDEVLVAAEAVI